MSYEPTVWKDGDLVTATKLNKMEQGIADASNNSGTKIFQIVIDENFRANVSYNDLIGLVSDGYCIIWNTAMMTESDSGISARISHKVLTAIYIDEGEYMAEFVDIKTNNNEPDFSVAYLFGSSATEKMLFD